MYYSACCFLDLALQLCQIHKFVTCAGHSDQSGAEWAPIELGDKCWTLVLNYLELSVACESRHTDCF
jgi:hypothetical protein